jgi:hypothetical protein
MILLCTLCPVKINEYISNNFCTITGYVQVDGVLCDFFNIAFEKVIQLREINTQEFNFRRTHQIVEYADDLDIIVGNQVELESVL